MLSWENLTSELCDSTIPLAVSLYAKDQEKSNISYKDSIIEFTFNYPRGIKKFAEKTSEEQMKIYLNLIEEVEKSMAECLGDLVHYFEYCKDGTVHMHGRFKVKEGRWYIEGIIQTFVKNALKFIDGRLKYAKGGYYPQLFRYRSACLCVQFTDEFERTKYWEQYIRKNN